MKITKITRLNRGLYAHVCPLCGNILASCSEPDMMPEFSICDCDKNDAKLSDIEEIEWLDDCTAIEAARALRKAGEFLIKSSRHD